MPSRFPIHPGLRNLVLRIELNDTFEGGIYTVLPGTSPVLGFQLNGRITVRSKAGLSQLSPAGATGLLLGARAMSSLPGTRTVLLFLAPWALPVLFHDTARQLTGAHIALEDLVPDAVGLIERLNGASPVAAVRDIQIFLAALVRKGRATPELTLAAAEFILKSGGNVRMSDLEKAMGWSRRQIERRFLDDVGVPPKIFAAVSRFRRAEAMLRAGVSPAEVALVCGYYDQPHLANEIRRFSR
jgi:AraC-like DNA-binding protein